MTLPSAVPGCPGCEALLARLRELEARLAELLASNSELVTAQAALSDEITELKARLQQNSQNSSRPPSSDPPWTQRLSRPRSSGRKRGGQPGHPGHHRPMVAPDQLTGSHDYFPDHCARCGHGLPAEAGPADPVPHRHQVWELPEAPPEIFEHRLHGRRCGGCGKLTWAELPDDVPRTGQGPRLEALVGHLTGTYRLSRRDTKQLVWDVWRIPLAVGTISRIERRLAEALEPVSEAIGRCLAAATQIHVDETVWKEKGKVLWLWTAATRDAVIYRIDERRNREALDRLLESAREATGGDLSAILGSDRLSVYNHWSRERHQHCLSHVQRTLAGAAVAQVDGWVNAKAAHDEVTNAFRLWDGYRRGELDREALAEQMEPVKAMMQAMLRLGVEFGSKKNRGLFQNLLREWDRLWVFVEVDGVEPTNNRAEQALRRAVIWRKTSFGSQSETGRRFAERMLTVVGTARLRGIAVLDYLTRAVGSHQAGLPIPLLPQAQPP